MDLLRRCQQNFGSPPRRWPLWERITYLRLPRPLWLQLNPAEELRALYRHLGGLYREGIVVWGHVIQANQLMFAEGHANCPGELLYSIEDSSRVTPGQLQPIARRLFELKGTEPEDAELQPIADYLTDERIRVFGLPVPDVISPSMKCEISTTLFVRKHLPMRRLCAPLLPIIVNPGEPRVALPLPEKFWPRELVEWWTGSTKPSQPSTNVDDV